MLSNYSFFVVLSFIIRLQCLQQRSFRKVLISCILSTDMSFHFDLIAQVEKIGKSVTGFGDAPADKLTYCNLILKLSDLSGPCKRFVTAKRWASLVIEEFNAQVAKEREQGLPFLPFMDLPDEKAMCDSEINFLSAVILPLYEAVIPVWEDCQFLADQASSNLNSWKELKSKLIL